MDIDNTFYINSPRIHHFFTRMRPYFNIPDLNQSNQNKCERQINGKEII